MKPIAILGFLVLLAATHLASAQTTSGPAEGSKIEPLKVFIATGDDAGKDADFAERRKDKPTIYIFLQADKWDRPVARFVRELDRELVKNRPDVAIVVVWLTEDVAKGKEYLPKAQNSLKLGQSTWTVHPGDKNGPNGWGINSEAHLTAIVADGGKVTASLGFRSVNEQDVPDVIKKLKAKP